MADSTSHNPPPRWPGRNGVAAPPAWNLPTQPLRPQPQRSGERWPYVMFGGVTLLLGALATLVVVLAR
ncbi:MULTISPECIES: hypothetical protein [unclassified Micromonospora]|uniref:hypothetical protein n=1 Tax=unclassified Micromonospora TaxID=2617518 RepID=UPI0033BD06FF